MTGFGFGGSPMFLHIAWILLVVFAVMGVLCVLVLLGLRANRRLRARRRERETQLLRGELIAVIVGEEPDASDAAAKLTALRGRRWDRADELLVGMLPKVRGEAKDRVLTILRARGSEKLAFRQLLSRRAFARCRGAFALGVLGAADASPHLLPLLSDRSPLVRRVAIRALGMLGDPSAAPALLDVSNEALEAQRDLSQAFVALGPAAAPVLRERVLERTFRPDPDDRSAPLAATALGMMGEMSAARELANALDRGAPALQLAAAQALGNLDSPLGVPALQRALSSHSRQVQFAAATSLGRLGAESAVPALLSAVEQQSPTIARSAASALLELGQRGRDALATSTAPYAVEALAIDAMRRSG